MDKISSSGNNFGPAFQPQRNLQSQNPNIEEMIQRFGMMNGQTQQQGLGMDNNYGLQGQSQDAMVSFSPEALSIQATQNQGIQQGQPPGNPLGSQLDSQISEGDLEGAQATLEALESNRPPGGGGPDPALISQLKSALQDGDAEGAQEIQAQIKASRPSGPPPQQQT